MPNCNNSGSACIAIIIIIIVIIIIFIICYSVSNNNCQNNKNNFSSCDNQTCCNVKGRHSHNGYTEGGYLQCYTCMDAHGPCE